MYPRWQLAVKYLKYYLTSSGRKGHGIHSPFVFHFISQVMNDKKNYPAYEKVENLRKQLIKNKQVLAIDDFGAGSSLGKSNIRTVAAIAKNSVKPKKIAQILFRMIREYQPNTILELGTSLGITTSYLSLAKPDSNVTTMEGAKEVAAIAKNNFALMGFQNISMREGNFDDTLSVVISQLSSVDFAFIDGNHRQEPTERYFQQLLSKKNNDSILVFDDIHWSREMEQTWETIQKHPSVRCTIDLFFIGIVFFREEFQEKQHFRIRF